MLPELTVEQIRSFRLRSHHLNDFNQPADLVEMDLVEIAGACGLQNSPPGAWENAVHSRIPACSLSYLEYLLYEEKTLLQAWSLRGAPMVFPTQDSGIFLSALTPHEDESWIYTQGILLALDFLQMSFNELLELLKQVMPLLDRETIVSKTALDQTLAQWMLPLIPAGKRDLWNSPSMYGNPKVQTVGGAVVSFLLRPCAFLGLVVFGRRTATSPSFTSYKSWTGHSLKPPEDAGKELVRRFLHCYGPATVDSFISWLGCCGSQGRRLWESVCEETETLKVFGKKACYLAKDRESLFSPASFERELLLLGAHDPYLDQHDRLILQPDKTLHRQIWKTVSNPGAIVYQGKISGIWTCNKKSKGLAIRMTLWDKSPVKEKLYRLSEEYADFRKLKLEDCKII